MAETYFSFTPSVLEITILQAHKELLELEDNVYRNEETYARLKKEIKSVLIQYLKRFKAHSDIVYYCKIYLVMEDLKLIKKEEYNYNKLTLILT